MQKENYEEEKRTKPYLLFYVSLLHNILSHLLTSKKEYNIIDTYQKIVVVRLSHSENITFVLFMYNYIDVTSLIKIYNRVYDIS